jgi:hypothetical protein
MDDTIVLTSETETQEEGITVSYVGSTDLNSNALGALTSADIANLNYNNISTITLPGGTVGGIIGGGCHTATWGSGNCYTVGTGTGINLGSGTTYTTGTSYNWNTSAPQVGIQVSEDSDIKIGDRSLKTLMQKMEDRLAILVPDQQKLEKFAALKKAYEHYKTLESLCFIEEEVEQK